MKALPFVILAALSSGCGPSGGAPTAPAPSIPPGASIFLATVTRVEPGDTSHPYLKWSVTLSIDRIVSGPSPGASFWFAIHSPSEEGVRVGNRYTITAVKKGDGYEMISRE